MSELHFLPLVELARRIERKDVSSVEVTRAMLERIEALEPDLYSYALVTAELALEQAAAADASITSGEYRGPLHGVPIALKDLCYTKGIPTAAGMAIHKDFRPEHDATVTARLAQAGAVLLGKLQMTEGAFALHHPSVTPPRNPWGRDYWAGSSSSGSGVATAAGLCFGSLGSDTGGSIRFPSASCSLTGLKGTWGRVSRYGVFPLSDSMDHVGPMTRTAADAAAIMRVIAGYDPLDPTSLTEPVPNYLAALTDSASGMRGLRMGIDESFILTDVEAPVVASLKAAITTFVSLGVEPVPVSTPDVAEIVDGWAAYCAVETAYLHKATYPTRKVEYGPLADVIELGYATDGVTVARINIARDRFKGALRRVFRGIDVMMVPVMPFVGPTVAAFEAMAQPEDIRRLLHFTSPFDMTGSPALTLPCGFSDAGIPIGMQLVGPHLSEGLLLRTGHAFQQATDWHARHPLLS